MGQIKQGGEYSMVETKTKNIIPGCGNLDCYTGVCRVMFEKAGSQKPTLAHETLIDPPGAIEGPPSHGVSGLVCTVAIKPKLQENCSCFVVRTEGDNIRDDNI
jgi:hypothetical protein